ncbi:hypothetical protein JCM19239_4884 [Vibrio variabilis]|uniref:Uncharacterized protein n=1 Tax=Vibrio variabilis TaxID=990271 RepID=A0ABQ0JI60_9VIBR|nr:hypothetical protein JCM19239_4884 [Vibrio variabilis]
MSCTFIDSANSVQESGHSFSDVDPKHVLKRALNALDICLCFEVTEIFNRMESTI